MDCSIKNEIIATSLDLMNEKPYSYNMVGYLSTNLLYEGDSIGVLTGVTEISAISIIKMLNGAYKNGIYKLSAFIKCNGDIITIEDVEKATKKFVKEKPYTYNMISVSSTNIFYDSVYYLSMNNVNNNSTNIIVNLLNGANTNGLTKLFSFMFSLNM
jgi:hypothetical protein